MKGLRKFMSESGGMQHFTVAYYSADVEAKWQFDIEAENSLQIVYTRKLGQEVYDPETKGKKLAPDENYWLYMSPHDAAVIGAALVAWAANHGESV